MRWLRVALLSACGGPGSWGLWRWAGGGGSGGDLHVPTAGRGAPPPARRCHHHRRSVLLSWFYGRVVVSAVDGTRVRMTVVTRAVPISTLELQSRVEHADAMATRRSRSSLRDGDMDDEVVMSWRPPLRGDEMVAVVASRRDDGMMDEVAMVVTVAASRRRDGRSFISCHVFTRARSGPKAWTGMPDAACQNSEFRYIFPRWHVHPPLVACAICHTIFMPHAACGMKPSNRC